MDLKIETSGVQVDLPRQQCLRMYYEEFLTTHTCTHPHTHKYFTVHPMSRIITGGCLLNLHRSFLSWPWRISLDNIWAWWSCRMISPCLIHVKIEMGEITMISQRYQWISICRHILRQQTQDTWQVLLPHALHFVIIIKMRCVC